MPIGPGLSVSWVSEVSSALAASCIKATASALRSSARSTQALATLSWIETCRAQYRFFASVSVFCNVASRSRSELACSGRPLRASPTARPKCGTDSAQGLRLGRDGIRTLGANGRHGSLPFRDACDHRSSYAEFVEAGTESVLRALTARSITTPSESVHARP